VAALPLTLSPDVGDVGLVWRDVAPGPALAGVLQAFDDETAAVDGVAPGPAKPKRRQSSKPLAAEDDAGTGA